MNIGYTVPFYSNTPDETHCFQAAFKMVLKYFEPNKDFSWEELEQLSGKKEGLWTWPLAGMVWMKNHGYEVVDIEVFDYDQFIKDKGQYILGFYGQEAGEEQIKHSDIDQEVDFAKKLMDSNIITKGIPSFDDLRRLLSEKYLIVCLINAKALNNQTGYEGHFVVIKGIEENGLILHDPGLPPQENRRVSFEQFEKAWAAPDENTKNVMAFRLEK